MGKTLNPGEKAGFMKVFGFVVSRLAHFTDGVTLKRICLAVSFFDCLLAGLENLLPRPAPFPHTPRLEWFHRRAGWPE
jgi:hypothetical protein